MRTRHRLRMVPREPCPMPPYQRSSQSRTPVHNSRLPRRTPSTRAEAYSATRGVGAARQLQAAGPLSTSPDLANVAVLQRRAPARPLQARVGRRLAYRFRVSATGEAYRPPPSAGRNCLATSARMAS
jgi:hypothetical protein